MICPSIAHLWAKGCRFDAQFLPNHEPIMSQLGASLGRREFLEISACAVAVKIPQKNWENFEFPFPMPKFAIGQKVCHRWKIDDPPDPLHGQIIEYFGIIYGISWNHPDWSWKGWIYDIQFVKSTPPDIDSFSTRDMVRENELEVWG